jgi:hypothetical protein
VQILPEILAKTGYSLPKEARLPQIEAKNPEIILWD